MLRSGRLNALRTALDDAALAIDELDRQRLEAELARRGRGPITELVVAARAHLAASTPHAAALATATARALEGLGGEALAARLLGERPPPSDPEPTEDERAEAASDAAGRARALPDFGAAAERSSEAAALAPESDRAAARRLDAAFDAWAAGDPGAIEALRAVRDDERAPPPIRAQAREALDAIEAEPETSPSWILASPAELPAGSPLAALGHALGVSIPELETPTASHLRAALSAAGVETLRVVLDDALLARLLAEPELLVVLEEEQSRRAAFLVARGLEETARLVLMHAPETGRAQLVTLAEQWRRSTLAGRGALIVTGAGERGRARREALEAAGVSDDPRLALVDRCHFDPDDPDVPFAHVAQLARQAIEAAPEIPISHARLGEALLELSRLGKLAPDENELERWVAETRERFPDAEWAHQIHAGALEHQGRWPEALVAWSDAAELDPDDDRNVMGQARAARRAGFSGGQATLRRALAANPRHAQGYTWLAEDELANERLEHAEVASELAAALAPDAIPVVLLQATIAEERGALDEATARLERVADAPDEGQGIRLWRRYLAAGRWDDLDAQCARLLEAYPASSGAWGVYVDTQVARGDGERALGALFEAVQRVDELPLGSLSEALVAFVPPTELEALFERLEGLMAGRPAPLVPLLRALALGGRGAEARASLERIAAAHPADANVLYNLGQLRWRDGDHEGAGPCFARTIELAERFPWVRYLEGWRLLERDPSAVIDLVAPVVPSAPALFWDLIARALDRTGREADAAELRGRLPEVAGSILEHADFLREARLLEPLVSLLELARETASSPLLQYQLGRAYAAAGRDDDASAALLAAYRESPGFGLSFLQHASRTGRRELVLEHAPAIAAEARRRSSRYADPWIPDALAAAAAHAGGDPEPRRLLLERAGRHVGALRALARAGRDLGSDAAAEDLEHLARIAPGGALTLDHPEL